MTEPPEKEEEIRLLLSNVNKIPAILATGNRKTFSNCGHTCWISQEAIEFILDQARNGKDVITICDECQDLGEVLASSPEDIRQLPGLREATTRTVGTAMADQMDAWAREKFPNWDKDWKEKDGSDNATSGDHQEGGTS